MSRISVSLVDDHPVVVRGLAEALQAEPDLEVVAVATSGRQALELLPPAQPDVAIVDVQLPDFDGIDLAEALLRSRPDTGIIILTVLGDAAVLRRALAVGVHVFLLKSDPVEEIVEAVRAVSRGERGLSKTLVPALMREFRRLQQDASAGAGMTELELRMVRMASEGASNEEIARTFNYSTRSVKRVFARICARLGVENRTQAVAEALRRELIR